MRKVIDSVREIIISDDIALESLRKGILNLSAYAEQIKLKVEEDTWKEVKKTTIVVALSRIIRQLDPEFTLRPPVHIDALKIQSPLCDISYERTDENILKMQSLSQKIAFSNKQVLVATQGMSEITIVASQEYIEKIQEIFGTRPKAIYENLTGISVGFSKNYLSVPNALFTLISTVASKRISVIELVSTYTEIMFVVEEKDREKCIKALEQHFTQLSWCAYVLVYFSLGDMLHRLSNAQ